MKKFTIWWHDLTDDNWGFPYHWIRMVLIVGIVFGGIGVEKLYAPWVFGPLFVYALAEALIQAKYHKSMCKEVQDLVADSNGLAFSLFVFNFVNWIPFVIFTVISALGLYASTLKGNGNGQ